jgi:hypothetical protein
MFVGVRLSMTLLHHFFVLCPARGGQVIDGYYLQAQNRVASRYMKKVAYGKWKDGRKKCFVVETERKPKLMMPVLL